MRRMVRFALLVGLSAGTVGSLRAEPPAQSEPVHQGKPVAYWVAALAPNRLGFAEPRQAEAEEALHALGPEAIPAILRYKGGSHTERIELIRRACLVLSPEGDPKLLEALSDSDPAVRETTLEILPKSTLPAAMTDLVTLVNDPVRPVRMAAILALVRLAPDREETITALTEALQDAKAPADTNGPSFSREDAALTLAKLGSKAKVAVPELTRLLTDQNDYTREAAATALWRIVRDAAVVPVLAECLNEARDYQTCTRLFRTLAEIGAAAKPAVPALMKRVEDPGVSFVPPTVDISQLAADALTRIDPAAAAQARKKLELAPAEKP